MLISDAFECVTVGRYPVSRSDCKKFSVCAWTAETGFTRTEKICAKSNSYFDPRQQACTTDYICPDMICNDASVPGVQFADPNDISCRTYFTCVQDAIGYSPVSRSCSSEEVFEAVHPAVLVGSCKTGGKCNRIMCKLY